LLLAGISLILLFVGWLKYLDIYTNHDDFILVPDFSDVSLSSLDSIVESYNLRYEIIDSIFDKSKTKGVVVIQDPLPNANVKENKRFILLLILCKLEKLIFQIFLI
jgi:beta-lactam-binding protein with PASTA domain